MADLQALAAPKAWQDYLRCNSPLREYKTHLTLMDELEPRHPDGLMWRGRFFLLVECLPMHRLARRLFTLCSIVSLLLCVAVCVLGAISNRTLVEAAWQSPDGTVYATASARGRFYVPFPYRPNDGSQAPRFLGSVLPAKGRMLSWEMWTQPSHAIGRLYFDRYGKVASAPHAWLAAALAAPPLIHAAVAWRRRHRRNARHGLCPSCGYDLRASLGRCPECGAATGAR